MQGPERYRSSKLPHALVFADHAVARPLPARFFVSQLVSRRAVGPVTFEMHTASERPHNAVAEARSEAIGNRVESEWTEPEGLHAFQVQ